MGVKNKPSECDFLNVSHIITDTGKLTVADIL